MDNRLTEFIKTGVLEGMKLGDSIDPSAREKWLASVDVHPNGKSRLYQSKVDRLIINIGATEDDRISYMVVHLNDLTGAHDLTLGDKKISLKKVTLNQLIQYLDENGLSWQFGRSWKQLITVVLDDNDMELVYSYFPGEVGLQSIQSLKEKDIDSGESNENAE